MGLGPTNNTILTKSVLEYMKDDGLIDKLEFSLFLGPFDRDADYSDDGEIVFGGYNPAHLENNDTFTYVNWKNDSWALDLKGISIDRKGDIKLEGDWIVIISSGRRFINLATSAHN